MEAEGPSSYNHQGFFNEMVPVITPLLLIAVGYIEPGKWAACIDCGAHFGGDLTGFLLIFYLVAVLFQYLSAHVTVVSGRNLAQICHDEYDRGTSILLGVQAELSMMFLDLGMILGMAQGLNMIFGLDLYISVFLTALTSVLFPLSLTLLETSRIKFSAIWITGLTFSCYVFAIMISQPEFSVPPDCVLFKLSGETVFALMSLLGANVMPHNFYLHSAIVQRDLRSSGGSNHLPIYSSVFTIVTIFSGISLVNFVLINSAANVFNNAGLVLLTFRDALSLMDQVSWSLLMLFAFFLLMFTANQISSLSWELDEEGRHAILYDFFGIDLPGWLHHTTIRIFVIFPALYCLWHSGAEGMYQMLILTQVMIALLLPSSAIPLFRIASSRLIMGVHSMSPFLEFLTLITLLGFVVLEIMLVVEMIFGDSDWVGNLWWNVMDNVSGPYILLLISSCMSLCSLLWMFVTPLKSASARQESKLQNWGVQKAVAGSFADNERYDVTESTYYKGVPIQGKEIGSTSENKLGADSSLLVVAKSDAHCPENLPDTDEEPYFTTIEESSMTEIFSDSKISCQELSTSSVKVGPIQSTVSDDSHFQSLPARDEPTDHVDKAVLMEDDFTIARKHDDLGDTLDLEEPSKEESVVGQCVVPEGGPHSLKNLSTKGDESQNAPRSLSRLSGLGRAARKQFSYALDEFWGQLYDFHGQITPEAKSRKLDLLHGVVPKPVLSPTREDSSGADSGRNFQPGRGADSPTNSGLSAGQHQLHLQGSVGPTYVSRVGSHSLWSHQMQSRNSNDIDERRYSSMCFPPSLRGMDYQPATVHGYQLASLVSRIMKDQYDYRNVQVESVPSEPTSLLATNYGHPLALPTRVKAANVHRALREPPPGFVSHSASRTSPMNYDLFSREYVDSAANQNSTKKYHSLPEISGLSLPLRQLYSTDATNSIWATPSTPMGLGVTHSKTEQQTLYSSLGSRMGNPSSFDDLSPLKPMRDASLLTFNPDSTNASLWSKPPFEQYGVASKSCSDGTEGAGHENVLVSQEPTSMDEVDGALLQSMRHCILKLLKLEGSDWLFRQNDGADEELIDLVAAKERFLWETESRDVHQTSPDRNQVSSVPNCGDGCVWKLDLVVSFGVWCICRVLELSLVESRPELWGRYTYVLNRLQGVIEMAFFKPRSPTSPCSCLQLPVGYQYRSSPPISKGMQPPLTRALKGTTPARLLDIIKGIEVAISSRKGRAGTAAGDVAFPKGKENLASVLKRYKRRLSNKQARTQDGGSVT